MLLGLMHSFYTILWVMSKTNPAQTTISFSKTIVYKYTKYSAHCKREQEDSSVKTVLIYDSVLKVNK